jgi:hypothetical protein
MKTLFDNTTRMEEFINDGTTISINEDHFIVKVTLPLKKSTSITGAGNFISRNDDNTSFYIRDKGKISYLSGYKVCYTYPNSQNVWKEYRIILKELMIMHRNMRIEQLVNQILKLNEQTQ